MILVPYQTVLAHLSLEYPDIPWSDPFVGNCTSVCQRDMIGYPENMIETKHFEIEHDNGYLDLPCDVYRLISINDRGDLPVQKTNTKNRIFVGTKGYMDGQKYHVKYKSIPVDNEGMPLIIEEHIMAHVAFVIRTWIKPQLLAKKIPLYLYNTLVNESDVLIRYSRGNMNITANMAESITSVLHNIYRSATVY